MIVLHHQFFGLYAHHSLHYFVHEFSVVHLLFDLAVEPLLFQQFADIFEANSRIVEGIFKILFGRGHLAILHHVIIDLSELRAEMPIEVFSFC